MSKISTFFEQLLCQLQIFLYLCTAIQTSGNFFGDSLAQQVEHIPFKDGVLGSSPKRITFSIGKWFIIIHLPIFFCLKCTTFAPHDNKA